VATEAPAVIVKVLVPGLPATSTPPEPTILILPLTAGLTGPPVLPVRLSTPPI